MKVLKTPTEILIEIESVNVDILQLSARIASGMLTQKQESLNSRLLQEAIKHRKDLRGHLQVKHGINITILNPYKEIQRMQFN